MKNFLFTIIFLSVSLAGKTQDLNYAKTCLNTLCSEALHGRGYVQDGDLKAAIFLGQELKKWKAISFDSTYFQGFTFPVNRFPGAMRLAFDGKDLSPGKDFIIHPESPSISGSYEAIYVDAKLLSKTKKWEKILAEGNDQQVAILDPRNCDEKQLQILEKLWSLNHPFAALVRIETNKLTWWVGRKKAKKPRFLMHESAWNKKPRTIQLEVDARFNYEHTAQNVIGYIEGAEVPDSFIVFSAHYDHLGRMGSETYFPGANDNASGTSMLLQLAAYYYRVPPKYSVVFCFFAGEEAGLLGSKHFTDHPLFPLEKIKMVLNLDIFGTGDEGITVVNAKEQSAIFDGLSAVNEEKNLLPSVKPRGQTQNSDHYPFSMQGVPAVFIYTRGGIAAYHDIYDRADTLPLTAYENLFKLLVFYCNTL